MLLAHPRQLADAASFGRRRTSDASRAHRSSSSRGARESRLRSTRARARRCARHHLGRPSAIPLGWLGRCSWTSSTTVRASSARAPQVLRQDEVEDRWRSTGLACGATDESRKKPLDGDDQDGRSAAVAGDREPDPVPSPRRQSSEARVSSPGSAPTDPAPPVRRRLARVSRLAGPARSPTLRPRPSPPARRRPRSAGRCVRVLAQRLDPPARSICRRSTSTPLALSASTTSPAVTDP
jgi:hypothetical protein